MKEVHTADSPQEAEVLRGLLRDNGIEATFPESHSSDMLLPAPFTVIWVDDADEERAREILAAHGRPGAGAPKPPPRARKAPASPPAPRADTRRARIQQGLAIEMAAVILLWAGFIYYWWFVRAITGSRPPEWLPLEELGYDAILLAQTFALLWLVGRLRREPFGVFGLRSVRSIDIGAGVLAFFGALTLDVMLTALVYSGWWWDPGSFQGYGSNAIDAAAKIGSIVLGATSEELLWRGYVLTRLRQATGSALLSVSVSSLLFAAYHFERGMFDGFSSFAFGILMGMVFVRTRRIWACVIGHSLWNLFAIGWN